MKRLTFRLSGSARTLPENKPIYFNMSLRVENSTTRGEVSFIDASMGRKHVP